MNRKILLVDDQADVLEALRLLLKGNGYAAETALNPERALAAAANGAHDMVLIDMNYARDTTSGAEGLALLDMLRARRPEVPVVVMTAWSTIDLAVEAMRRGASDFITKPWENERVLEILAKQAGRSQELSIARRVQRRLLPAPRFRVPGAECVFRPAGELGGDLCDVLATGPASSAFLLGDVSGKGTGAAILMANLQATIRGNLELAGAPAMLMSRANRLFFQSTEPEHYASLFFGSYDAERRELRYVNCGHPAPVLLRAGGGVERLGANGVMLGAFENSVFEERSLEVAAGDRLVVFSDGVSEARESDDAWVVECLRVGANAEGLAMAAAGSGDDVTVLELRFSPFDRNRD
jgi:sigma-B regulation protein RsbU (phosphoserine phosphatase)